MDCDVRLRLHLQAARFRVLKPDGRSHGDRCYTCFVDLAVYSRCSAPAMQSIPSHAFQ